MVTMNQITAPTNARGTRIPMTSAITDHGVASEKEKLP